MLLNMITLDKVSMRIDFQENEVMPLLHGALQLFFESLIKFYQSPPLPPALNSHSLTGISNI